MMADCEGVRIDSAARACVEQGPTWLVELTVEPPTWLYVTTQLAIVAAIVLVGYAAWRVDIDEELIEEVGEMLLIVGSIAAATSLVVSSGRFGYVADVGLGTATGYCAALAMLRGLRVGAERVGHPQ